ncbi:MAG: bifunctional DNA primase/polymerase, partial [Mesorhizobium sp.]
MAKLNFKTESITSTPLDVARSFIAAGIPVFPCHEREVEEVDTSTGEIVTRPEKSPYTSNGLKGATRSERIINIWFNERHPSALIGVPTGEPLGAWVLDLDRHGDRDGHDWLADMEAIHGPLPETARAKTANGGTHVFFKNVEGIRNRAAIAPGVDSRGQDGYVCGPGSVMADGRRYGWVDRDGTPYEPVGIPDFADAPQWLLD